MAPRPTWKGYLKVSLVNIPVKVFPATESAATISFNQLHAGRLPIAGQARRVLRDKVQAHDLHIGGAGLDLGSRDEKDTI